MIDSYVCLDLETTGLEPHKDKIIEIGAIRVRNGKIEDTFETLVNPERALEERITQLTGIVDKQLENAPVINEVLPELLSFIGDDVLLGHSILFDYSFVKRAAVNNRLSFEKTGIDTLKLARKYLPDLESRSLEFLCRHFEIEHSAHRAVADAKATIGLYDKLAGLFYEGHEADFKPVQLKYRAKRETAITIPQKNQLYKLLDKHKLKVDYNVEKLTRSEASRFIAQILAEYGR
ncbi:MAG: 3'-5' exonuclease [Butyrivibrio sp.]|nr:3'-5' exonuclease [Butyrivibrio sp.]